MSEATKEQDPRNIIAHFFILADGLSHSGARVAAAILLNLYNGHRFLFDLTDLRRLDERHLTMALTLMRFDACISREEVHEHLNKLHGRTDFGPRLEHIAHKWRMKGKCKRDLLTPVQPLTFQSPF